MKFLEKLKITDTFKQWRDKINSIIEQYSTVPSTDTDTGEFVIDYDNTQAYNMIVNIPTNFNSDVTFDNITVNGTLNGVAASSKKLDIPVEINGAMFDGTQNITTPKWGEIRNIQISDFYSNHISDSQKIDGSTDIVLKLPETISANIDGSIEYASKLSTDRLIDGITFNGSQNVQHFCVCNTASGVQIKTVILPGFNLTSGASITIKFINANTASNVKLNVNNLGAKPIYLNGDYIDYSVISANSVITFIYNDGVFNVSSGSDNKMLQVKTVKNNEFPILLSTVLDENTTSITSTSYFSNKVTINPYENKLTLSKLNFNFTTLNDVTSIINVTSNNGTNDIISIVNQNSGTGKNIAISGSGITILGSGNSPVSVLSGTKNSSIKDTYISSDKNIYFYTNAETYSNKKISFIDTLGNASFSGTITASAVYNAVWNDYAEFFPKGEETKDGDIIALDENSKVEQYIKATSKSKLIVGVHSNTYGHILGGKESIEKSLETYIPVGLVGRVDVNFIGKCSLGDPVVPSEIPGVGCVYSKKYKANQIIGYVVEDIQGTENFRKVKILLR